MKNKVAIIMGSKNDWPALKDAKLIFDQFAISYDIEVVSAHRTPEWMYEFAKAASNKYDLILAGAGGSAHLPGMISSLTTLPVIAIPIFSDKFQGIDAVMSMVQMPKGTPVGVMGVNNSFNGALYACKILSLNDKNLVKLLVDFKNQMKKDVHETSKQLNRNLRENDN